MHPMRRTEEMTLSTDTIRTVIEIVPDWSMVSGTGWINTPDKSVALHIEDQQDEQFQMYLDALAAAGVRELNKKGYGVCSQYGCVDITKNMQTILSVSGKDETDMRLEAIAEFVKGGGFDG